MHVRTKKQPQPPADADGDAALVSAAQAGDASAFAALVSRYEDRVFNTCYRMCHHHADALDLTQTAFLKAFEALPNFKSDSRFYTWIYRIAVNLTISKRRAARSRAALSLDRRRPDGRRIEVRDRRRDSAPERNTQRRELRGRLQNALQALDEEFRAAVVLKDIEGFDYAAIAEILEVPPGTVKSRIHRGRMMLRKLLRKEESPRGLD